MLELFLIPSILILNDANIYNERFNNKPIITIEYLKIKVKYSKYCYLDGRFIINKNNDEIISALPLLDFIPVNKSEYTLKPINDTIVNQCY